MMNAEHWALLRMAGAAVLLGVTLIKAVSANARLSWVSVMGLSFPAGMAVIALVCLVLGMMRVPLKFAEITMALSLLQAVLALLWFFCRKKRSAGHSEKSCSCGCREGLGGLSAAHRWMFLALALYVVYQFYFIVANAFLFPIHVYDAIVLTALKSKVFFYDGSIEALEFMRLKSYPLFVPFEMFWVALNLGRWDDTLVNSVFPLTYFGFSLFQYAFMRERYGAFAALAAVALTTSAAFYNYHASIAYQDYALMVFNVAAQMFFIMCHRRQDLGLLPLSGVFAGLAICVKLEGVAYWVINAVLCVYLMGSLPGISVTQKVRTFFQFLLPGVGVYLLHAWFSSSRGFLQAEGRYAFRDDIEIIGRLGQLASNYTKALFLYNDWTMLWAVLLASLVFLGPKVFKDFEVRLYGLVIVLSLGMFFAVDILTHNYISHHSVLSRVMLHFFPVVPMLIIHLHEGFFRRKTV